MDVTLHVALHADTLSRRVADPRRDRNGAGNIGGPKPLSWVLAPRVVVNKKNLTIRIDTAVFTKKERPPTAAR